MPPKLNIKLQWRLLLWKSWKQQRKNYLQLIWILIIPFVVHSYLLVELSQEAPTEVPKKEYKPIKLDLDAYKKYDPKNPVNVLYTPDRKFFENILKLAKEDLPITYAATRNVSSLEKALRNRKKHMAGVVFDKKVMHSTYPTELEMTLRFPAELRRDHSMSWETNHLLPDNIYDQGPRNPEENDGGVPVGYLSEGFLQLQNSIIMAYLRIASGLNDLPTIEIQRFPYPSYTHEPMCDSYSGILMPSYVFLSFLYPILYITYMITDEKKKYLKEMMKISGIESLIHFSSWLVTSFVIMEIVVIILTIFYTIELESKFFPNSGAITICIFLTMYAMALICQSIMISTFFNDPRSAVYFLSAVYLFSNLLLRVAYDELSLLEKLGYCLLTNSAMNICCLLMRRLECSGQGVANKSIYDPATLNDDVPLVVILMIFGLQSMFYLLIALYLDQIIPGNFGIPKGWFYPLTAQFWCNRKEVLKYDDKLENQKPQIPKYFEDDSHKKRPILEAKQLTRMFGKWLIVKNVSFNLFASEISVLLGPAGSGKSVLLSLLTGTRLPHIGTTLILGRDIRIPEQEACRHVGVCFGDSVLWDNMTAEEHLIFYSKLRSPKGKYNEEEVDRYLELIGLENESEVPTSKLKLGIKRKIMICNALCGNVNVLICEEPTVGLDPDSRLEVWNLLKAVKRGRAVFITTESLYEAEMLGDRIAILCDGELKCFGTKFFLKKLYGSGHRLICNKSENCDVNAVSDILRPYIPDIRPIKNTETEVVFILPDRILPQFATLLSSLEDQLEELKLEDLTIETASMEEVYMSAGGDSHFEDTSKIKRSKHFDSESGGVQIPNIMVSYMPRVKGCKLLCNQWKAMFLKKALLSYHSKLVVFIQIFLPAIVLILRYYLFGGAYNPFDIPPMTFGIDQYRDSVTYLEVDESVANDSFESELVTQYKYVITGEIEEETTEDNGAADDDDKVVKHHRLIKLDMPIDEYLLEQGKENQSEIDKKNLIACSIRKGKITAWMNNNALHAAPLSLNVLHNAMAKVLLGDSAKIKVTNHPQPITAKMAQRRIDAHSNVIQNYLVSQVIVLSLYVLNPNAENVSQSKQLQFTCGVRIWIYWLSHLAWDVLSVTISTLLFTITMALTEGYAIEMELASLLPVTLAFGFCVLCLTYLLSFIFQRSTTAFGVLVFFYYIGKLLVQNLIITYNFEETFFFWFPFTAYAKACDSIQLVSIMEKDCKGIQEKMDEFGNCKMEEICCVNRSLLGFKDPGILTQIVWLLAEGAFLFVIVLLIDYQVLRRLYDSIYNKILLSLRSREGIKEDQAKENISQAGSRVGSIFHGLTLAKARAKQKKKDEKKKQQISKNKKKIEEEEDDSDENPIEEEYDLILFEDDDVLREKRIIKAMKRYELSKRNLVVDRVTKNFGRFSALDTVSFQIKKRECFGISGVSGCGKSSMLKVLINEIASTSGNFYIRGNHVKFRPDSSKKAIGYCPQNDAFFKNLTGRENLKIFLLCRGVEWKNLNQFANELASTFQITKILNSKSMFYGRGSRRKLSLAIAIIGPPGLLIFDEPTSTADPASKRRIWDVINKLRETSKSILVSSKNIDECESLCTRMGIMVNGKLMCMGSKQHLREKYSQGCILTIKFYVDYEETEEGLDPRTFSRRSSSIGVLPVKDIEEFVQSKFPEAKLRQRLYGYRIYYIPNNDMKWSEMFAIMEEYRNVLRIQDYSIGQKSLEEIYLDFSKYQKTKESKS